VNKPGVCSIRWVVVVALVVGCSNEIDSEYGFEEVDDSIEMNPDAGADAGGCPEYRPDDAGVIQIMRGCPLTIEYSIK
jgi:hypothetical protein